MIDLSGYSFEHLRQDGDFTLSRGKRPGAPASLLLLSATLERPAPSTLERIKHSYSLRDELDSAWATRPLDLADRRGIPELVLHDPGGDLLEGVIGHPFALRELLRMAVSITKALGCFHARGLIHRDIKPANILVSTSTGGAWLTSFALASRLPRHRQPPAPPEIIAGTLAYMAPEQTGRMNRSIDSRSDLYSLGVTLYEMFVGALPFTVSDPMDWVHCHIARVPEGPSHRRGEIPEQLSAIILKLLSKAPEDRYQTAEGLEADLQRCLSIWEERGRIDSFPLGARDVPNRVMIPEKLYGREREVEMLLTAFDRVVGQKGTELVLVSGYSGVGKSSVVNELHKALVPPRGIFAAGKFDQYKRDVPYATLAQAFQSLIRQILGRSESEIAHWRSTLLEALESNGQLIINLIPEIELIIGAQQPVADLSPQEAQARFQSLFRRFLGVFARPEHPLALFLDDLQWLDAATLKLLEYLVTEPDVRHVIFIGAYRDNEVDPTHPLTRTIEDLQTGGAKIQNIVLQPLTKNDVSHLVSDSLRCEPERVDSLARLVFEKSDGNPFFTIQFVTELEEEGLLSFDSNAATWRWDIDRIRAKGYTDNVVDLMVGKLNRFPNATQESLKHLACLGNSAEFELLRTVYEDSEEKMHDHLWEAVRGGLVFRSENSYLFLHDRVQEAAYSLIPAELRSQAHLRIGRILANNTPRERLEETVFDIVNQLNRGSYLITDVSEREQAAELNLIAGRRAKSSAAFVSALKYLHAGSSLLSEKTWDCNYELIFSIESLLAECEVLTAEMAAAENRLTMLAQRARSLHDFAVVTRLQITLYTTLDRSDRAIEVFLDYLRRNGTEWLPHPSQEDVMSEYRRVWSLLGDRQIEDLVDLPLLNNPDVLDMLDVFTDIVHPAMFYDENLSTLVACRMVCLSLEHGNCDASCFGYVWFGMFTGPRLDNYKNGFRFGQLGYELVEKRNLMRHQARTYISFGTFTPWAKHAKEGRDLIRRTFEVAYRTGDLTFSAYSWHSLITNYLAVGDPLSEVQSEAEKSLAFNKKAGFGLVVENAAAQLGLIRTLRGLTSTFGCFDTDDYNEADTEHRFASNRALVLSEFFYWTRKLQARFFAGDYATAIEASQKAHKLLWPAASQVETGDFRFFAALARAAAWNSASSEGRQEHVDALKNHHRQLEVWALHCPANFETRAALVSAEISRIEGRLLDAEHLYETAIRSAHENGFVHCEAVANECAAQFYSARGFTKIAHVYTQDARHCYLRWGANGKVQQLDRLYPHLAPVEDQRLAGIIGSPVQHLDVASVVKAMQALSSEIELPKLIERLMTIAIENAGADRGLLILPSRNEFLIRAQARASGDQIEVTMRQEPIAGSNCPESLVRYVIRMRESVILDDASKPNLFSDDDYLRDRQPKSILCLPLIKQRGLTGVLLLENTLTSHVFTPARIAVLELLASQAAISLENATLYTDLQLQVGLLQHLPVSAWTLKPDGTTDFVNQVWLEFAGQTLDFVRSHPAAWMAAVHPEDRDMVAKIFWEGVHSGQGFTIETRFLRTQDGTYRWYLNQAVVLRDSEGKVLKFVGTTTDIDDQKRTEDALRRSEAYLAEAQKLSHTGSWAFNPSNDQVNYWSEECFRVLGFNPEEGVPSGEATFERIHKDDLAATLDRIERATREKSTYEAECRYILPNGDVRDIHVVGKPVLSPSGELVEFFGTVIDITEQKRAEEGLRRARADLAHVSRLTTLGEMSASIAHEVNQPLGSVVNNANACLTILSNGSSHIEEVRQALEEIIAGADRASAVISRVRNLSKKVPYQNARVDLNQVVTEVMSLVRHEAAIRDVMIHVDTGGDLPAVLGDRVQLQQVLLNLVVNGIEAMATIEPAKRTVVISGRWEFRDGEPWCLMSVKDAGIGVNPEIVDRLFEAFYTTKSDGMGMGLAISRSIIEAHGGQLWFDAEEGAGTTFQFRLPADRSVKP
jgi:PAS domain S-box-containing protein